MKKTLLALLMLFLPILMFSQELTSVVIEEEELDLEIQRALVMQELDTEDFTEEEWEQFRSSVRERLMLRKVILIMAETSGLIPDELTVEQRYMEVRNSVPDQEVWDKLLEDQLYTEETFRYYLRDSISIDRLLEEEVLKDLVITDEECREYYDRHPDEFLHEGELLDFETVKESLTDFLLKQKAQLEVSRFMDRLLEAVRTE